MKKNSLPKLPNQQVGLKQMGQLAILLAEFIINNNTAIIFLEGEMGAGKTTLSQFLISRLQNVHSILNKGLQAAPENIKNPYVASPTFNIMKQYKAHNKTINHFDLYRLENESQLIEIGFIDIVMSDNNISIIEWPQLGIDLMKNCSLQLNNAIKINIKYACDHTRYISIINM